MYNNNIVDCVHRYTKAYLEGKKEIKAYIFNKKIMKKFLINKQGDSDKVDNMKMYEFIELFYKRLC